VEYKLEQELKSGTYHLDPLYLSRAIVHTSEEIWQLSPRNTQVVALLLKYGADPNEKNQEIGGTSVWNNLVQFMGEACQQRTFPKYVAQYQKGQLSIFDITRLLLEAGANPMALIFLDGVWLPAITINEKFGSFFPQQTKELKELIRTKLEEIAGMSPAFEIEGDREMMPAENKQPRPSPKSEQVANSSDAMVSEYRALVRWGRHPEVIRQQRETRENAQLAPAQIRMQQSLSVSASVNDDAAKHADKSRKRQSGSFRKILFRKLRRSEEGDGAIVEQSPSEGG